MRTLVALLAATGLFWTSGSTLMPAMADGGDPTQVHACVSPNGSVRILTPDEICKTRETSTHWSKEPRGRVVYDANDTKVGDVVGLSGSIGSGLIGTVPVVVLEVNDVLVGLRVLRQRMEGNIGRLIFPNFDCDGMPFVELLAAAKDVPALLNEPIGSAMVSEPGILVYVPDVSSVPVEVEIASCVLSDGICQTGAPCEGMGAGRLAWPTLPPVDLSTQFTPPFDVRR